MSRLQCGVLGAPHTGADPEVLPAERRRVLDQHSHL